MVTENTGTTGVVILKPGVGSAYGNGWRQLWTTRYFGWLLLVLVIMWALSSVSSIFQAMFGAFGAPSGDLMPNDYMLMAGALGAIGGLFSLLYWVFFTGPLNYGVYYAYLKAARGDKMSVEDMFACFKNYWNVVGASVLVFLIVLVGFIFVIVPGIYFACKLAFVPYLVVDRKMRVGEALSASWKMTAGHGWKVFFLGLLSIPITIAGFICLVVGVIIAEMWIYLAFGSLYHAVEMEKGELTAD